LALNVVRIRSAFKGAAANRAGDLSLEQLIGGGTMLVDGGAMRFDAGDFGFQYFDPLRQFVLRQRPQILLDEQGQRIARPAGEEIVVIHGTRSVDRARTQVNKLAAPEVRGGVNE
jgi:hypothetical protein